MLNLPKNHFRMMKILFFFQIFCDYKSGRVVQTKSGKFQISKPLTFVGYLEMSKMRKNDQFFILFQYSRKLTNQMVLFYLIFGLILIIVSI